MSPIKDEYVISDVAVAPGKKITVFKVLHLIQSGERYIVDEVRFASLDAKTHVARLKVVNSPGGPEFEIDCDEKSVRWAYRRHRKIDEGYVSLEIMGDAKLFLRDESDGFIESRPNLI